MIVLNDWEQQEFELAIDTSYRKFIVYDVLEVELIPEYAPGDRGQIGLKVIMSLTDDALNRETSKKLRYDQCVDHTLLPNITPSRTAIMRVTLAGIKIALNLACGVDDNVYALSITMKNTSGCKGGYIQPISASSAKYNKRGGNK